jgi:hypothetical protein
MALLRVDNCMSEETDEVVRHDNKGVAVLPFWTEDRRRKARINDKLKGKE